MTSSFALLWEFLRVSLNMYYPDAVFLRYLDIVEQALAAGEVVLIENLEESVDPVLGPLLGRETIKKGRWDDSEWHNSVTITFWKMHMISAILPQGM